MPESDHIDPGLALRALPLPELPASGWPRLQATLQRERRRRQRRWLVGAALAASVMLLVMRPLSLPTGPVEPRPATDATASALAALQAESATLDALLADASDSVFDVDGAARRVLVTDRIAWIDALLAADPDAELGLALWRERVLLLRELALLQQRERWLLAATLEPATPMVSL